MKIVFSGGARDFRARGRQTLWRVQEEKRRRAAAEAKTRLEEAARAAAAAEARRLALARFSADVYGRKMVEELMRCATSGFLPVVQMFAEGTGVQAEEYASERDPLEIGVQLRFGSSQPAGGRIFARFSLCGSIIYFFEVFQLFFICFAIS